MEKPKELSEMTINERGDIQKSPSPREVDKTQELVNERQQLKNYWLQIRKHSSPFLVYAGEISHEEKSDISLSPQKASDFFFYLKKWKEETAAHSSPATIRMNRYYQKIIGLGDTIIPLILRELEREPNDWFYALEMLTKDEENPMTDDMGFKESISAWINWGKNKGYI